MEHAVIIGLGGFLGMILMTIFGIPIYIALLLPSIVGMWLIGGNTFVLEQFTVGPYNITADYTFAVVPMFVLMGELTGIAGIADGAFAAFNNWFGKVRGGLLIATICASAAFGACCGTPMAGNILMTKIALPEVEKYGYEKKVSMGCIASSGVLQALIPPSIPIMVLCILTNLSVGRALMAGLIPGIVTAIALSLTVFVIALLKPTTMPVQNLNVSWGKKFSSLTLLWPILVLFILILGGMYAGIFPATVGGAIGAVGALIFALVRKVDKRKIVKTCWDAALTNAQLFPMLLSGFIFARFVALTGIADSLSKWIAALSAPPLAIMSILFLFYIFMGAALELMPIIIITIPIVFPLVTQLGYDPYVFCIILILMMTVAGLSPPTGMPVFTVASVAKTSSWDVFMGALPFFVVMILLCWFFILFPDFVVWLPNLLYGATQ